MSKRKKDPQVSLVNQVVERRSELVEKLDHPLINNRTVVNAVAQ
jgi:hypothetical protein